MACMLISVIFDTNRYVLVLMSVQELYRQYTDLSHQHDAEVGARRKQQESRIDLLHSTTAADDADDATKEQLSTVVGFLLH